MKKWFSVRKWILPVVLGVITLLPIVGVDMAYAKGIGGFGDSDALKGLAAIAAVVINIFTFLALVITNFFSDLIGTDFIIGDQAMNAIKPMWIIVRNLVNVMFVVMLVFLAFSNLFASIAGEGGGNWTIKEKLPKIIISLVAINFSLLGFRLIIDAVNVGTVAILGIADHKLEGDDQISIGGFVTERTWKELKTEAEKKLPITSEFTGTDDITRGGSCTSQYQRYMHEHPDFKDEIVVKKDSSSGEKMYACRTFMAQINDVFCPEWKTYKKSGDLKGATTQAKKDEINSTRISEMEQDTDCMFMMNPNKLSSETILQARNAPGQNLFMAFGTVFMHLEKLPSLAAHLGSLDGVLVNTLFSALMSIMFLVALVAVFLALLGRLVVLWVALVFSPAIVAVKVMGMDSEMGDQLNQVVTAMIMPLKIAAAFAVGFVMLSAMVTVSPGMTGGESTFWFGASLSQMGQDEYAILWQVATIFLFWKAAKWSVEGNMADFITDKIFSGAQNLGGVAARAATIDRPLFSAGTGENATEVSLGTLLSAPEVVGRRWGSSMDTKRTEALSHLGWLPTDADKNQKKVQKFATDFSTESTEPGRAKSIDKLFKELGQSGVNAVGSDIVKALKGNNAYAIGNVSAEIARLEKGKATTDDLYKIAVADGGLASKVLGTKSDVTRSYQTKTSTDTDKTPGDEGKKAVDINDAKKGDIVKSETMKKTVTNDETITEEVENVAKKTGKIKGTDQLFDKAFKSEVRSDNKLQKVIISDTRGNPLSIDKNAVSTVKNADELKGNLNSQKRAFIQMDAGGRALALQEINNMVKENKSVKNLTVTFDENNKTFVAEKPKSENK